MKKEKLATFIDKYSLGGLVNSVMWECKDNLLSTKFQSDDRHLVGSLSMNGFQQDDFNVGIYETDQLYKLIKILGDEIDISIDHRAEIATAMNLSDGNTKITFMLSLADVIPTAKQINKTKLPEFEIEISLDSSFRNSFIKGFDALANPELTFTVMTDDDNCRLVLGHSSTNTNTVTLRPEATFRKIPNITFMAKSFREMLSANKECTAGTLQIADAGLLHATFDVDGYSVDYYSTKKDAS